LNDLYWWGIRSTGTVGKLVIFGVWIAVGVLGIE